MADNNLYCEKCSVPVGEIVELGFNHYLDCVEYDNVFFDNYGGTHDYDRHYCVDCYDEYDEYNDEECGCDE